MPSTKFKKEPPVYDRGVRGDATSYLKNYSLFTTRIMWGFENRNPAIPEKDIRNYISNLIKPLAFDGYTKEVEEIKNILIGLDKGDINKSILIKTVVEECGSYGGLLSSKEKCILSTSVDLGPDITTNFETVNAPTGDIDINWTELEVIATEWRNKSDSVLSDIQGGDELELFIGPSETGKFEVGFSVNRI
jgi:hypothetical protein